MTNPIVDKIRKLLALANDQIGKPEGEQALEIAEELMNRHNLTLADVEKKDIVVDGYWINSDFKWSWRTRLIDALSTHFDTRVVISGNRKQACVIGTAESVAVVHYLFDVLARYIIAQYKRRTDGSTPASFCGSAVRQIARRLYDFRAARVVNVDPGMPESALVFVGQKLEGIVNDRVGEMFPSLKKMRAQRINGSIDGLTAGKNAPLNTGIGGTQKDRLALN